MNISFIRPIDTIPIFKYNSNLKKQPGMYLKPFNFKTLTAFTHDLTFSLT
jgi:hypothetical protein